LYNAELFNTARSTKLTSKKLSEKLSETHVDLVTTVRKNMKAKAISAFDRAMLSKRYIIETINDQLKNISQVEHSRHRSETGFMLNVISGMLGLSRSQVNYHLLFRKDVLVLKNS
jgi:hypothetical protein